jgi:Zn-dependent protease with chaperone function
MRRLTWALALAALGFPAPVDATGVQGKEEKAEGYLEYRQGEALIVDGQRVVTNASTRLKLRDAVKAAASIPLGYEVKARGRRRPDGALVAAELEAKPNGSALFEKDVKRLTDRAEAEYRRAGRFFNQLEGGRTVNVGTMREEGAEVERARRIVDALVPSHLRPQDVRVYVIENDEWNAFAMGNFSIYVFRGLLRDMDDDEVAIVLGHEIAHATHEHTRRQFKKSMWIQLAAIGVSAAAEDIDDRTARVVAQLLVAFGASAWQNGYGRDLEDQADRVGLRYAYEAGYDIGKGPRLWERFARKYGEPGKAVNFFFGNHSLASQRAANLQRQIAVNYPDGPKTPVARRTATGKATASGRGEASTAGAPPGAAAFAGAGRAADKEIRAGMTSAEVRALMGEPGGDVSFGSRRHWTYPGLTVVFANGRVVEVKF